MPDIVNPTYADGREAPQPCRGCGTETQWGSAGYAGRMLDFIDHTCEEHDRIGVRGIDCDDCWLERLYFCAECRPDGGEIIIELPPAKERPDA